MLERFQRRQHIVIGTVRLRLARGSRIGEFRANYQRYDQALADIARICHAKYPDLTAIDIGANVGDTAALIQRDARIPVLCIEGDASVTPILAENAKLLHDITIVDAFVGPDGQYVDLSAASDLGSNASLVSAVSTNGVPLKSLEKILTEHPPFGKSKLIKTDTQGFDFRIIRQSVDYIRAARPVIFLEYDPSFNPSQPQEGLETLDALQGYRFLYYDNFGHFMCAANERDRRVELDQYLRANRRFGTAVHYFDVCAVHEQDADIYNAIRQTEAALVAG